MSAPVLRYRCLELLPVRWKGHHECAVLHEIGPEAGLFQVDEPVAPGATVFIQLPDGEIPGVVHSCVPEADGYVLTIAIQDAGEWLEGGFRPAELVPLDEEPGDSELSVAG